MARPERLCSISRRLSSKSRSWLSGSKHSISFAMCSSSLKRRWEEVRLSFVFWVELGDRSLAERSKPKDVHGGWEIGINILRSFCSPLGGIGKSRELFYLLQERTGSRKPFYLVSHLAHFLLIESWEFLQNRSLSFTCQGGHSSSVSWRGQEAAELWHFSTCIFWTKSESGASLLSSLCGKVQTGRVRRWMWIM